MSGAQAKAAVIAGCIGVVAEVLCITVTQKLHYAFLNWSIFACSSDHLSSNPVVRLGIQFLNPSIYCTSVHLDTVYLSKSSTFTFPSGIRNRKGSNPYESDRFFVGPLSLQIRTTFLGLCSFLVLLHLVFVCYSFPV